MKPLYLEGPMKEIALKHGIDLSKLDFKSINANRDKRMDQEAVKFTQMNNRLKKNKLFENSLISDEKDLEQVFGDFKVNDSLQQAELDKAKRIAERINNGETGNFTFSGNAGSGKTLLAISILNYVNANSNDKYCYFLSFEMYISMVKASFNDSRLRMDLQKIEKRVVNCDVFVLDDLGSETAMQRPTDADPLKQASNFNQESLFRFADYRKSKTNIVTTNNSSKELQSIYNPKIYSRLIAKKAENAIRFDSRDMRNI